MNNFMKYSILILGIISASLFFYIKPDGINNLFALLVPLIILWFHVFYSQIQFNELNKSLKEICEQSKLQNRRLTEECENSERYNQSLIEEKKNLSQTLLEYNNNNNVFNNNVYEKYEIIVSQNKESFKKINSLISHLKDQINNLVENNKQCYNDLNTKTIELFEKHKEHIENTAKEIKLVSDSYSKDLENYLEKNKIFLNEMSNEVKNALFQTVESVSEKNKTILNSIKDEVIININLLKTVFDNKLGKIEDSAEDWKDDVCDSNKEVSDKIKNLTEVFSNLTTQLNEQHNKLTEIMKFRNNLTKNDLTELDKLIKKVDKSK